MGKMILYHPASTILRAALISLEVGSLPNNQPARPWPIFVSSEPDQPDNAITIYDTQGTLNGRFNIDGEVQEHFGIQVRVRATSQVEGASIVAPYLVGHRKITEIAEAFDQTLRETQVTVNGINYTIHNMSRTSGVINLGTPTDNRNRNLLTINYLATITQEII